MLRMSSSVADVGVGLAVLHVRPEAADAGDDVLAVVGMLADGAGQREQLDRAVEVDVVGRDALGQARALGLHRLAVSSLVASPSCR